MINEQSRSNDLLPSSPVQTFERFALASGLSVDCVRGMAERGQLPTLKIGKRRLVNVVLLLKECVQ